MSHYNLRRISSVCVLVLALLAVCSAAGFAETSNHIVISQVYGGGGNTGATFTNDFIEIFNPTPTAQSLAGYSVQYASSTGSSWAVTSLPSISLQPGQYLLVQESQGAGGTTPLPTPDAAGTIALSATAGKIALSNATTALTGTCPTTNVVDLVGYGAANCSETAPVAALTNTTAALRLDPCVDGNNNSTEFSSATPNPRNTSTTLAPCNQVGPGGITVKGLAAPTTVNQGSEVLLTATLIPGTNPTSTGLAVVADLSGIGGSATQPFFDDGTNGDATAGDNIFSYTAIPTVTGTFALPVTASDSQLRSSQASIALTVVVPPQSVTIQQIQSAKPSPYVGQSVTTSGIVIGVKSNGFYIEAKNASTSASTPQGVLIYTSSTVKPSYIAVGNEVQVSGKVATYPPTSLTPGTEIDGPQTFTLLTTGNALPPAVTITQAMDSPSGGIYQFARLEGMRVAIDSLTTTSGTDGTLTESTETNVSNGLFYGVVTGIPRPFREPGVGVTDTLFGPLPPGVPIWDSNPELLYIDSKTFGGPAINLTSNTTVTGLSGVMDFSFGAPEIILDATNHPTLTGGITPQPVPAKASNEFTVASFNMERFYNDKSDADNPGSSAVVVTTEAYQRRLAKASLAIRNILNMPDVIGAQEIENLPVLQDLAQKISTDAVAAGQPDPQYTAYLFLANDISAINTGMLVKSTVNVTSATQYGLATTFTNSTGSQAVLNDRTPIVLQLGIKRGGTAPDYPVTVISVHQRSLINVDDPTNTGATVRLKREAQAEYLANLIQSLKASGPVISVGDYNGFEFSDGFVDVLGVTKGNPVPASQVVTPPVAGLVNPPLVDLITLLPADQRQSYVETGSAQVLDHVLVTTDLIPNFTRLVHAHIDSDFPLVNLNDATSPTRISDHDPAVAYFSIPPVQGTIQLITTATLATTSGGYTATVLVKNNGTGTAQSVTLTGATLGAAAGSPLPYALGDVQPGATAVATFLFPASAGTPGAAAIEKYTGTYTGGTFGGSIRAALPKEQ